MWTSDHLTGGSGSMSDCDCGLISSFYYYIIFNLIAIHINRGTFYLVECKSLLGNVPFRHFDMKFVRFVLGLTHLSIL